ncbi:MAG: hypothetical protein JNL97_01300, partial [Verrucomicrobiales bacterium]|nr:hypothetical protein [Verrucomicrobiales bacterium]
MQLFHVTAEFVDLPLEIGVVGAGRESATVSRAGHSGLAASRRSSMGFPFQTIRDSMKSGGMQVADGRADVFDPFLPRHFGSRALLSTDVVGSLPVAASRFRFLRTSQSRPTPLHALDARGQLVRLLLPSFVHQASVLVSCAVELALQFAPFQLPRFPIRFDAAFAV